MTVRVYADETGKKKSDPVSDPVLEFLSKRGASITVVPMSDLAAGSDNGESVICDLADLRRFGGDRQRFLRASSSAGSVLVAPALFTDAGTMDAFETDLVSGPSLAFVSHPAVYEPVLLELKRFLVTGLLGECRSGAFSADLYGIPPGGERDALLYGLDLAFHLFGRPAGRVPRAAARKHGAAMSASFRAGTAELHLELRALPAHPGETYLPEPEIRGKGGFLFSDGELDLSFGTGGQAIVIREPGKRERKVFTAEGPGRYYLALDLAESINEGRCSGILDPVAYADLRRAAFRYLSE